MDVGISQQNVIDKPLKSTADKKSKALKVNYISFISVVSALAVIILHSDNCFWEFNATARYWKTAMVIHALFYFAVPVFFMITGVTLIDFNNRYGVKTYFKKRISKTVIPYIVWSIIAIPFNLFYEKNIALSDFGFKYIVKNLLNGSMCPPYWFFIPLFGLYLAIPLFAAVKDEIKTKVFGYLIVAALVINYLLPYILSVAGVKSIGTVQIPVVIGYAIYPILGYMLNKKDLKLWQRLTLYCAAIACLLFMIIMTYNKSIEIGNIAREYKDYTNILVIIFSAGVFVLLKNLWTKISKYQVICRIIAFLSSYTFCFYLIHWYILRFMIVSLHVNDKSIIYRLFAFVVVVPVTILITFLIRKIPVVKRILP